MGVKFRVEHVGEPLRENTGKKGLRPFGIILQSDVGFIPSISTTL